MIPELLLFVALGGAAWAQDAEAAEEPDAEVDPLAPYRVPFDVLAERAIGAAAQPVEFNWRRKTAMVAATGGHPFELNNFNSLRAGGLGRFPVNRAIFEVGVSYVWVWDSPSSELLALTPYRQPSRPPRLELDLIAGLPVAEGVVTSWPRRFPAVQMTVNLYGGFRYLVYPTGFRDLTLREAARAVVSPTLTDPERANLEDIRLDAMQVDPARYGVMVGVGNDLYLQQGLFLSPRAMFALPLLAPVTETEMYFQAEFSLVLGVAF
ncbi:hypothetical protein L6R49_29130 [Myxococcota bacterium]|nr:hypothetical protein [Myxococcota bacterium]